MKCPYCKGKNLYVKRTSPMVKYGCKDCEEKVAYLKKKGMSENEIRKFLNI